MKQKEKILKTKQRLISNSAQKIINFVRIRIKIRYAHRLSKHARQTEISLKYNKLVNLSA